MNTTVNENALEQMVTQHLPLVSMVAASVRRSIPVHVELDDLVHAGMMGLFEAATKYREEKRNTFAAYAQCRIRGAMLDSLRQQDCGSRSIRKHYKNVKAATQALWARLERQPTENEIAAELGINCERLHALLVEFRALERGGGSLGLNGEDGSRDAPADPVQQPDRIIGQWQARERLRAVLNALPERDRRVVELYYGGELTMRQIGTALGVNESRICQIHKEALRRMQLIFQEAGVFSSAAFC